jgi:hypothetical protein
MGPRSPEQGAWQRSRNQLDRALAKRSWLTPVAEVVFGGADPAQRRQATRRDLRDWAAIEKWAREISAIAASRPAPAAEWSARLTRFRAIWPSANAGGQVMSGPTEPAVIRHGLAVYQRGQGCPLLALPHPHASGGGPMIDGPLVSLAAGCGFRVSTFDPPGQYRSTRPARVSLDEMVDCATETLGTLALPARVAVIGHSMSAPCAFYFGLAHPDRVAKLVLVGTPPGSGMAIVRYRAMPFCWPPWNPNLWHMAGWGILLASIQQQVQQRQRPRTTPTSRPPGQ